MRNRTPIYTIWSGWVVKVGNETYLTYDDTNVNISGVTFYPVRLCQQCYTCYVQGRPIALYLMGHPGLPNEWVCDHWFIGVVADFLNTPAES